jgi:hypothetical protein
MIWSQKAADILLVEDDARDAELALEALQERSIARRSSMSSMATRPLISLPIWG